MVKLMVKLMVKMPVHYGIGVNVLTDAKHFSDGLARDVQVRVGFADCAQRLQTTRSLQVVSVRSKNILESLQRYRDS